MPLFILISGYLTKAPDRQSPREMWHSILNLFITLVVFHLLSGLLSSTASIVAWVWAGIDENSTQPMSESSWIYYFGARLLKALKSFPFGILWYLMSLIYWRVTGVPARASTPNAGHNH